MLGGGLPVIAPQNPSSPDSAVRQLRATFFPEVTPKAAGSAAELLLHSCSGPPVSGGTDRMAGGAVVGFWVSPTPWQSWLGKGRLVVLSGGSSVSLGPRDRRAQQPATRAGLPRGGAPGPRARTLRCWRPVPRARLASRSLGQATPDSRSSLPGRRNQRRAAALRGFGCTTRTASGRREAVPSFATVSSSPAQHPRTPTHSAS